MEEASLVGRVKRPRQKNVDLGGVAESNVIEIYDMSVYHRTDTHMTIT